MSAAERPAYLQPYARAVKRHGADFRALLWASRRTQEQRFDALARLADPTRLTVLDLGCGRGDLLDFFIVRNTPPRRYIGIEGVRELANAAEDRQMPNARIICGDFVTEPSLLNANIDIIYCSGALNTLENDDFYKTIERAFAAARRALVFNFLSSELLAGVNYLRWHAPRMVMRFARTLSRDVKQLEGYIDGDCSIAMWKEPGGR